MISIQTILNILITAFAVIVFAATIILTYVLTKRNIRNDINKCTVLANIGGDIIPIKGKLKQVVKKGFRYNYGRWFILVPRRYKEEYVNHRRLIFVGKTGQLISSPFDKDIPLAEDERNDLIYEIVESAIGNDAVKAAKSSSKAVNIVMIIVIAFIVGLIAIVGYNMMQGQITPAQTSTIEQPIDNTPIEVK